jgi:signal peptidase I
MNEALDWFIHIAVAILAGVLIVTFVAQRVLVHDISMQPTLVEGDNLIVEKLSPRLGGLHSGDIIVFSAPNESRQLIKRLIAVEGDLVEIKDGKVYVNGSSSGIINPPGVETLPGDNPDYSNFRVEKGYVYALGDNRPFSNDCRNFGPISIKNVKGRAILRFYPFSKFGKP